MQSLLLKIIINKLWVMQLNNSLKLYIRLFQNNFWGSLFLYKKIEFNLYYCNRLRARNQNIRANIDNEIVNYKLYN